MAQSPLREQSEREDKFEADPGYVVPVLDDLLPEGGRIETATLHLENTYYDTAAQDLLRQGLTLRRRAGGPDAGWHLKVPAGAARTELQSRSRARTVPRALADPLLGVRHGEELVAVATLRVRREVLRLHTEAGQLLAEVADDQVESSTGVDGEELSWREVEVELGSAGDEQLLVAVGARLVEWGARPSGYGSKLRHALGLEPREPAADRSTLGALIAAYLDAQYAAILQGDLGLRLGKNVVHPTRVGIRRLRSTLRVFATVFNADRVAELEAELVWFAGLLGEVRDRDVLRRRLLDQVAALPADQVVGPVADHLGSVLAHERDQHLREVLRALRGDRYAALLRSLADWRSDPPTTDGAEQHAAEAAHFVQRAQRKLERRLHEAEGDVEKLHRARKAGKRFRYAAELAEPELGKKASRSVERGKELQELLGEHQDSVVSATLLSRLGAAATGGEQPNGFTYGILLADELARAERIRDDLQRLYG